MANPAPAATCHGRHGVCDIATFLEPRTRKVGKINLFKQHNEIDPDLFSSNIVEIVECIIYITKKSIAGTPTSIRSWPNQQNILNFGVKKRRPSNLSTKNHELLNRGKPGGRESRIRPSGSGNYDHFSTTIIRTKLPHEEAPKTTKSGTPEREPRNSSPVSLLTNRHR
jgi:hypothetical protein